ncbi:hypothetical protein [Parapedomonas caeni]|jgi:hypothetical protein
MATTEFWAVTSSWASGEFWPTGPDGLPSPPLPGHLPGWRTCQFTTVLLLEAPVLGRLRGLAARWIADGVPLLLPDHPVGWRPARLLGAPDIIARCDGRWRVGLDFETLT